ncbi:MAG: hypothetical protein LBE13_12470 [Bacteroidales bacterium]|jgi:hypothetical protein|nr:hypothetical protein [Bacteroidales bacterium]
MNIIQFPIVVYLCRYQDKDSAGKFSRFVESYKKHPAGCDHLLIIIRKGFEKHESEWDKWTIPLYGISFKVRTYPDEHYTFGYLRLVMEDYPDQYILFCMATCEILVDNWLNLFMQHAQSNRILGCCGSYESANSNNSFDKKMRKLNQIRCSRFSALVKHNVFCLKMCPYLTNTSFLLRIKYKIKRNLYWLLQKKLNWEKFCLSNFYPFPNPALRTATFMVPPQLLKTIYYWPDIVSITSKNVEFLFESGKYSLSIQALIAGYELFVIGADGKAYPIEEWRNSKTFRSHQQENLIIADHHNRCYDAASDKVKKRLEEKSYGQGNVDLTSFWERIRCVDITEIPHFFKQKNG